MNELRRGSASETDDSSSRHLFTRASQYVPPRRYSYNALEQGWCLLFLQDICPVHNPCIYVCHPPFRRPFPPTNVLMIDRLILQCMLHWRFALNGNATVKGTGTWQSVEDERMLSLVQVTKPFHVTIYSTTAVQVCRGEENPRFGSFFFKCFLCRKVFCSVENLAYLDYLFTFFFCCFFPSWHGNLT